MAEGRFEIFRRARRWPLRQRWLGQSAAAGGVVWLVALAVLVATDNIENVAVRILFGVAGMLGGLGLWRLSSLFSARSARVGCRAVSFAAFAVGGGFAVGTFVGFLLAYFGLLFVTPAAFLTLAVGLLRSKNVDGWVKGIPWFLALAGVVLYGFHAVARDVWDPHDALWLALVGVGWFLLGLVGRASRVDEVIVAGATLSPSPATPVWPRNHCR